MHRTYQEKQRVTVAGSSPAGLAVNERSGAAYATDLANDRIIEITPRARTPRLIPAGDGPLSIALSRDGRTAYAAGQADGALSLIDLRKGIVTKKVPTGAGALSVTTDPASGRALVANRTDATVTVVDELSHMRARHAAGPVKSREAFVPGLPCRHGACW
ncbi:YncE family protein [Streptomyces decoyicus]|uniref:YncE family protein n=1 Tax=Streptomyces decoyicus TaxID=249567 RepID=UPI00386C1994